MNKNRVHFNEQNAKSKLQTIIYNNIKKLNKNPQKDIIILCIGTDRSTGDSLGPLTGTMLKKDQNFSTKIFGNINEPVHAENLNKIKNIIQTKFKYSFIIAIDAGLGKKNSIGDIQVKNKPLKPGTGVNKNLTEVGDMHITGLVNVGGYMEYLVLQSTRLSLVMKMAEVISYAVKSSISTLKNQHKKPV